jgi:hypothetical protein
MFQLINAQCKKNNQPDEPEKYEEPKGPKESKEPEGPEECNKYDELKSMTKSESD